MISLETLGSLADECEARARLSRSDDVRSIYHRTARDLRSAAELRRLGEHGLRLSYDAAVSQARFAAFLDGDSFDAAQARGEVKAANNAKTTSNAEAVSAPDIGLSRKDIHEARQARRDGKALLNAAQLERTTGVPQRTARDTILRGWRLGFPGFYREGRRLYAEQRAFERLRATCRIAAE
jgi:hypothetical protein